LRYCIYRHSRAASLRYQSFLLLLLGSKRDYCRSTLCIRAAYAMERCMAGCPLSVRPRLSATFMYMYCVETAKHFLKHFHLWYAIYTLFQFFPYKILRRKVVGGIKCRWGMKRIAIFDQHVALTRKRHMIGPSLVWNATRNLYAICRTVPYSMTLNDF